MFVVLVAFVAFVVLYVLSLVMNITISITSRLSHTFSILFKVARTVLAQFPSLPFAADVAAGADQVECEDDPNLFEVLLSYMRVGKIYLPQGVR